VKREIDLNSDLGEGAGHDAEIMPLITSANIACGGHAGDERTMRETIALALRHGVAIGAHPGYPDRANFGRLPMNMDPLALIEEVAGQIRALAEVADAAGVKVTHVKAHGAMYNQADNDAGIAKSIASGIFDDARGADLLVFAAPRSKMLEAARAMELRVASEVFADRAYEPDGTLVSRRKAGAVIHDPDVVVERVLRMATDRSVVACDGSVVKLELDTICVHGDTPGAADLAARIREALGRGGVDVKPVGAP